MNFENITSIENLFQAWEEFKVGKGNRKDVQIFGRNLEDNLFSLHQKLMDKTYQHGSYESFFVHDPKVRHIHKASVQDRILHHLLYKYLYRIFDRSFIYDSYSCRLNKGTHRAVKRLEKFTRIISKNYTKSCWALKLDIKQFFASVDHQVLKQLLRKKVQDENSLWVLDEVIQSFCSCSLLDSRTPSILGPLDQRLRGNDDCKGIPLGNLTSQVFANIYMNELDQFIKHQLRIKCYIRYADDFVILSQDKHYLNTLIPIISKLLNQELKLSLHPNKVLIRKYSHGIDFLGYIILPYYILPRTKTKRRIFTKLKTKIGSENFNQSLQSYLGYLSHANSYKLELNLKNQLWLWGRD